MGLNFVAITRAQVFTDSTNGSLACIVPTGLPALLAHFQVHLGDESQ
jgi:hypothetical protein